MIALTVILPDATSINVKVPANDKVENVMNQIEVRTTLSRIFIVYLNLNTAGNVIELRIGSIFLPRIRPTLGPQLQSQNP